MKRVIKTDKAPMGRVPLSQAIQIDNVVYCSGQLPIDPRTGRIISSDIRDQARQVFENLRNILEAAGSSLEKAVKVTIYMTDLAGDFDGFQEVFERYFPVDQPARTTVEVRRLALPEARVEVELIATA